MFTFLEKQMTAMILDTCHDVILYLLYNVLNGMAFFSASDSAYTYTFLCSVVCLSVACYIRTPCLIRSTN